MSSDVSKEEKLEQLRLYKEAEKEIIATDKNKIMKIIEERRIQLNAAVEKYMNERGKTYLTDMDMSYILTKNNSYINVLYTARDMEVLFEWYKDVNARLQLTTYKHHPTRMQFCQMIGISTADYELYLNSDDKDMVNIMTKIEDYIQDILFRMGSKGDISNKMAQYQLEAVHGVVVVKKTETTLREEKIDVGAVRQRMENIFGEVVDADFNEKESEDVTDEK